MSTHCHVMALFGLIFLWFHCSGTYGQLSQQCTRPADADGDVNYAWSTVNEIMQLGPNKLDGFLLVGLPGRTRQCISEMDPLSYVFHVDLANGSRGTCQAISSAINWEALFGMPDLRFFLGFGQTMYYAFRGGLMPQNLSDLPAHVTMNVNFHHEHLDTWMSRYVGDPAIEAVSLISTSEASPSYPSAILSFNEPQVASVLDYQPVNPLTLDQTGEDDTRRRLGYTGVRVTALYLPESAYGDSLRSFIFFSHYYAPLWLNLTDSTVSSEGSSPKLPFFPILPAQGAYGCPVNLCWWPVMDDAFVYADRYWFLQGTWLWTMKEGGSGIKELDVEVVVNLGSVLQEPVYGLYFDYNLGWVAAVVRDASQEKTWILKKLEMVNSGGTEEGRPTFHMAPDGETVKIHDLNSDYVYSATMLKSGGTVAPDAQADDAHTTPPPDRLLWVAYHRPEEGVVVRGFFLYSSSSSSYHLKVRLIDFPHQGMVAFFYHPSYEHLFIIAGFFLYIYQSPDPGLLKSSLCTVTYANVFFNCTNEYYDMNKMDQNQILQQHFKSREEYFALAKESHHGALLPDQCNFVETLPSFMPIPFEAKILVTTDDASSGVSLLTVVYFIVVSIGVLGIVALSVKLATRLKKKGMTNETKKERRRMLKERKLKLYLKMVTSRSNTLVKRTKSKSGLGVRSTTATFSTTVSEKQPGNGAQKRKKAPPSADLPSLRTNPSRAVNNVVPVKKKQKPRQKQKKRQK